MLDPLHPERLTRVPRSEVARAYEVLASALHASARVGAPQVEIVAQDCPGGASTCYAADSGKAPVSEPCARDGDCHTATGETIAQDAAFRHVALHHQLCVGAGACSNLDAHDLMASFHDLLGQPAPPPGTAAAYGTGCAALVASTLAGPAAVPCGLATSGGEQAAVDECVRSNTAARRPSWGGWDRSALCLDSRCARWVATDSHGRRYVVDADASGGEATVALFYCTGRLLEEPGGRVCEAAGSTGRITGTACDVLRRAQAGELPRVGDQR